MFYPNELHEASRENPGEGRGNKKRNDLATQLIRQLAAPFRPEKFHDTYRENVEKLIAQKQKGEACEEAAKSEALSGDRLDGGAEEEPSG